MCAFRSCKISNGGKMSEPEIDTVNVDATHISRVA